MGRFTGAFLAGCLLFLSAPLGMMIGAAMPWLDPETLGSFNLGHYAWVYLLVCVPTLSKIERQEVPPLVVFQMPPATPPIHMVLVLVG